MGSLTQLHPTLIVIRHETIPAKSALTEKGFTCPEATAKQMAARLNRPKKTATDPNNGFVRINMVVMLNLSAGSRILDPSIRLNFRFSR